MTLLSITAAGQGTLLIPDPQGEEHSYLFRPIAAGISLAAWEVLRTDTAEAYRVAMDAPGRWTCSCPAQTYRKRGAPPCKHIQAMSPFWLWLQQYLKTSPEKAHAQPRPTVAAL